MTGADGRPYPEMNMLRGPFQMRAIQDLNFKKFYPPPAKVYQIGLGTVKNKRRPGLEIRLGALPV